MLSLFFIKTLTRYVENNSPLPCDANNFVDFVYIADSGLQDCRGWLNVRPYEFVSGDGTFSYTVANILTTCRVMSHTFYR